MTDMIRKRLEYETDEYARLSVQAQSQGRSGLAQFYRKKANDSQQQLSEHVQRAERSA